MLKSGIDSTFISADITLTEANINQLVIEPKKPGIIHRISNRMGFPILNSQKNYHRLKDLSGKYEIFSMPTTNYSLESLEIIKNADIINLHWIANFVNFPAFFNAYKHKPIVWTLHDMNPFMGGFHYRNDFLNNTSYHKLENYLFNLKYNAIKKVKNLSIITPSKWLMNEAIDSNMFKKTSKFNVIPYSLDFQKFKPHNKNEARKKLAIKPNLPSILIISQYLNNHRKGFDIFIDALKSINTQYFQIITIGNNKLNIEGNFHLTELGSINDDELLAIAYSAADLFVIPSREDNLPNVMLESFACGTPVLSFKTGGMHEWIIPGFNGIFANSNDVAGLRTELEKFINSESQFDNHKIREFAINNFSEDSQVSKYLDLYKTIS